MGLYDRALRALGWPEATETRSLENPTIPISASYEEFLGFFGQAIGNTRLPPVTIESALEVPAVLAAVNFLSSTLAALPLHAYRTAEGAADKLDGELAMLLNEAPNPDWSSYDWRKYMWHQVFTGGRGVSWIERKGVTAVGIWPMDPTLTTVHRKNGRKFYRFEGREYASSDVIDVTFMLRANQVDVYGPIYKGRKAIALAIAMNDFASAFFGSGGTPPLALEGPVPSGVDALKRAQADIQRTIELAKKSGSSFFAMPPGHSLKPIGIEPGKGQMAEAQLFQIQQIARVFDGLPPAFLGDLSKGTFANTEQQDLQVVKHTIGRRAKQLEDELNLKLFGQRRRARKVKHNLDALQRGDFKSRTEGMARAIQTGQITPNEARALEERPPMENGDQLYIQGATVPLGTVPAQPEPKSPANETDEEKDADDGSED